MHFAIGRILTSTEATTLGLIFVAMKYNDENNIKIYKDKQGLYYTTTNSIVRQTRMDGDTLARYLCHVTTTI